MSFTQGSAGISGFTEHLVQVWKLWP